MADRRSGEQRILERQMTDEAIAARTKRRSRSELRRADNDQLLEWWVADRSEEVRSELAVRYQQMAKNLASRFANRGESREDLAQVAAYGILKVRRADYIAVSYTHLRAHETVLELVCRLLLAKKIL